MLSIEKIIVILEKRFMIQIKFKNYSKTKNSEEKWLAN